MKIVYTSHQFFPEYGAGTETLAYETAKGMKSRGHEVFIFTGHPVRDFSERCESFDRYEYDGMPVERFFHANGRSADPKNPMEAEYNNRVFGRYFEKRLSHIRPDIVHFYHLQRISASPIDVCTRAGVPTVFTATDFWPVCPTNQLLLPDQTVCNGPDPNMVNCVRHLARAFRGERAEIILRCVPPRLLRNTISRIEQAGDWIGNFPYLAMVKALARRPESMRKLFGRLNRILVATDFMAEALRRFLVTGGKIGKLPFGMDLGPLHRDRPKGEQEKLRVGFIGTLYPHKGAHILLQAVARLPRDLPLDVKVYGSLEQFPDYVETLRSIANEDPRIQFRGTFPKYRIGEVFSGLDLLVLPSLWHENTPLTLHAAQAAGVPVAVSRVEGLKEIVREGRNGLFFQKGDVRGLSEVLQRLYADRRLLRSLSDHSVKPKSVSAYVDELEGIYEEVLEEHREEAEKPI